MMKTNARQYFEEHFDKKKLLDETGIVVWRNHDYIHSGIWMENQWVDGIFYGLRLAFRALIPGKRLQKEENYRDFVAGRQEKRVKGYGFLLISGAVTIAVSLLFLGLYYL